MKKITLCILLALSGISIADNSVTIDNMTFTCSNTCNVTANPNGGYTVEDCCGGTMSVEIK